MVSARLAVTGASGQLGRALRRRVPDAVFWTREELDITDAAAVAERINESRPSVIVNAAAYTNVDKAETMVEAATSINEKGARNVADAATAVGARVVFPSTNFVYSGTADTPYTEDDEPDPISVYGRTKAMGEAATLEDGRNLVIRTSALYGEGHNFVRSILAAARTKPEVSVVDDQLCQPTYSMDFADTILHLIERRATGIYHFAGRPACSWAYFAEATLRIAGIDKPVVRIRTEEYEAMRPPPTAPRPRRAELDCSKASAAGIEIGEWEEALKAYLESA